MVQQVYECMYIFDSNRYARDPGSVAKLATELIETNGGEVLVSRLWNEQRLAYPINGNRKGTYWLTYFSMPGDNVKEFDRACEISDDVLRHLTLKIDPRLVDTLVAHARGEGVSSGESEAEGESGADGEQAEATVS